MKQTLAQRMPPKPRILLIKLRSIGDVIYNTSVYTALKKRFPDSHLTVLVEPASLDIVRSHPAVDQALCFRKGRFFKEARFYLDLFRSRYDVAIDMHEGTRGALMCFVSQAKYRVGNKYAKRSFLYNEKLDFSDLEPRYPIDYQVALIKKMGAEFDEPSPEIHFDDVSGENARRILDGNGIGADDQYGIIHCGTRKKYDQWQFSKFAELSESIAERFGVKVILTCGPGEESQAEEVLKNVKGEAPAFFTAPLQELGRITRSARFAVCHNGGYMHLASALKTPVVALFGVVNPRVWKPLGDRDIVLYKELECSPCNSKTRKAECFDGDAECKRRIEVDDVLSAVESLLQDQK